MMPKPLHRPRNPTATLSALPPEILEQILLYLPPKALLTRFRLICKSWTSLITTSTALKYYSTTSTLLPTSERQIKWYQYLYDFNPVFLDVLYRFWKRLIPLWVKYKESEDSGEEEKDRVNVAFVREIEVLYLRYLHIFSTVPMLHPVYWETRQRVIPVNWGASKSRSEIVLDQEFDQEEASALATKEIESNGEYPEKDKEKEKEGGEREKQEQTPRSTAPKSKLHIPFAYPPRSIGFKPSDNCKRLLIYLCRFIFMYKPAYNGRSSAAARPETISTRIDIKVYCAWANKDLDTEVEGRTLSLLSYGSDGNRPVVSKFDVDNVATTIF